jgi:Helix-turn-helix domain
MPKKSSTESAWKYVKLAFDIKTEQPAQHHILLILANHADQHGGSFPSYKLIMEETAYGSKQTIASAIKYLRDELGILAWKRGWGNEHVTKSNSYCLDFEAMSALVREQKSGKSSEARGKSSEESGESSAAGGKSNNGTLTSHIHNVSSLKNVPLNTTSHEKPDSQELEIEEVEVPHTLVAENCAEHNRPIEESTVSGLSSTAVPAPAIPMDDEPTQEEIDRVFERLLRTEQTRGHAQLDVEAFDRVTNR